MTAELYIGLMSGTSMDAIDAALVEIDEHAFSVHETVNAAYPADLRERLARLAAEPAGASLPTVAALHVEVAHAFVGMRDLQHDRVAPRRADPEVLITLAGQGMKLPRDAEVAIGEVEGVGGREARAVGDVQSGLRRASGVRIASDRRFCVRVQPAASFPKEEA